MVFFKRVFGVIGLTRLIGFALLMGLLTIRYIDPTPVQTMRNQSFDLYQRLKPRVYQPAPVVIVDIDEQSIRELGQWPWPRTRMAELIEKIAAGGSVATALDMVFAEEDRLSPANVAKDNPLLSSDVKEKLKALPSNDEQFAKAISQYRVILGQTSVRNVSDNQQVKREVPSVNPAILGPDPTPYLLSLGDLVQNLPEFEKAAAGRGVFNVIPDPDGVFRKVPLVLKVGGAERLTLSAELLRIATGGQAFAIKSNDAGISGIVVGGKLITTNRNGFVWPYFSQSNRKRFVSAADVIHGKLPANRLRGHLVLIGTSAVGLEDYRSTPMGVQMPGVEIHAQLLENILQEKTLTRPNFGDVIEWAAIIGLGLIVILLVPLLGALWSIVFAGGVLLGYLGFSYYVFAYSLFEKERLLVDPTFPVVSTLAIFILMATANYIREERQREQIRGAFGQYVSPALVDQLSDNPEKLELGGETRDLSVLFSDVRGFTAISESYRHNPQGLTELMNSFLTTMSDEILKQNGTIDKFMGDAVMAFWNAPLDDENHEFSSCRAAIGMIDAVEALNKQVAEEYAEKKRRNPEREFIVHDINIGIGINSGPCVVGNMGSRNRFDYTALGDTVNIASRLEGQSKPYGIKIVLGANTARAVEKELAVFEVDLLRVKGKDEPERIYGLFGAEEQAQNIDFKAAKALNRTMLQSYRAQQWEDAFDALGMLREVDGRLDLGLDDYLFIYETRIAEFRANPPGRNWDGVYTATSK